MRKISVLGILNFLWGNGIHTRGRKGKSGLFFPSKIVFSSISEQKLEKIYRNPVHRDTNGNILSFLVKMDKFGSFSGPK